MNLFSRFRRPSFSVSPFQSSSSTSTTPTAQIPPPNTAENSSLQVIPQKIHPDLNALAAELSPYIEIDHSSIRNTGDTPPHVSLKPWIPKLPPATQVAAAVAESDMLSSNKAVIAGPLSHPEFSQSNSSFQSDTTSPSTRAPSSSPSMSSVSTTGQALRRVPRHPRLSPSPIDRPPSAWNTRARRRKPRRSHIIPHSSDFGGSSHENSPSHSRRLTRTSQVFDVSDSWTSQGVHDESNPHSRSESERTHRRQKTDSPLGNSSAATSAPSSAACTFGRRTRRGPSDSPESIPQLPTRTPLRMNLFDDTHGPNNDEEYAFNFRYPRPTVSMPAIGLRRLNVSRDSDENERSEFAEILKHPSKLKKRSTSLQSKRIGAEDFEGANARDDFDNPDKTRSPHIFSEVLAQLVTEKQLHLEGPFDYSKTDISASSNAESSRARAFHENFGTEMPSNHLPSRSLSVKDGRRSMKDQAKANENAGGTLTPTLEKPTVTSHPKSDSAGSSNTPMPSPSMSSIPQTPSRVKGKRKAEEVEGTGSGGNTPPEARKQKATFANDPRPYRISGASGSSAPSSYQRKRARLSTQTSVGNMPSVGEGLSGHAKNDARPPSRNDSQKHHTGSWSKASGTTPFRSQSRTSQNPPRPSSRAASTSRHQGPSRQSNHPPPSRRGSISQVSIPISALISPHAPSISTNARMSTFHMRDPRKPPRVQPTPWSLSFPQVGYGERLALFSGLDVRTALRGKARAQDDEEGREPAPQLVGWTESGGSPLHAWLFFVGFILFPTWWVAAVLRTPKTRRLGGQEDKKMTLDDPQVEHDAMSWRRRCRIMAVVSLLTYVPFVVLVAVFARRSR